MGNQEAAAPEDHDIPASYHWRLDFFYDDEIPWLKPRTHASTRNAQNNVAAFANSVEKLTGVETLRAGNQWTGWLARLNSRIYGLAVLRRHGQNIHTHLTNLCAADSFNSLSLPLGSSQIVSREPVSVKLRSA